MIRVLGSGRIDEVEARSVTGVPDKCCAQCGTPCGSGQGSYHILCDDMCLGAWLDRQPGGHFAQGVSGPLCGERWLAGEKHPSGDLHLCDLHKRLGMRELAWRRSEGHALHVTPAREAP